MGTVVYMRHDADDGITLPDAEHFFYSNSNYCLLEILSKYVSLLPYKETRKKWVCNCFILNINYTRTKRNNSFT